MFAAEQYKGCESILKEEMIFRYHMDQLAIHTAKDIITEASE